MEATRTWPISARRQQTTDNSFKCNHDNFNIKKAGMHYFIMNHKFAYKLKVLI